jgi:predicted metal-dependent HD superfamily phosphohydrolase
MDQESIVQLYRAYRSPGRFYHGIDHINDCFSELHAAKNAGVQIDDEEALRFGIWYHDYVYDGRRNDNEELSAEAAYQDALRLGYSEEFAAKVKNLVLVTKHSGFMPTTNDEHLICDIDLASLASDKFAENTELIRKEYAFVPEAIFRSERKKILVKFNERQPIYYTPYFRDLYEAKAHENLTVATA